MDTLLSNATRSAQLNQILRKVALLQRIDALIKPLIDPDLTAQCQVANIEQQTLIIGISNAAWLTRLRFLQPQLLEKIQAIDELAFIQDIRLRIQPHISAPIPELKPNLQLSKENAEFIKETASHISDDTLREALLRIAEHGE